MTFSPEITNSWFVLTCDPMITLVVGSNGGVTDDDSKWSAGGALSAALRDPTALVYFLTAADNWPELLATQVPAIGTLPMASLEKPDTAGVTSQSSRLWTVGWYVLNGRYD